MQATVPYHYWLTVVAGTTIIISTSGKMQAQTIAVMAQHTMILLHV